MAPDIPFRKSRWSVQDIIQDFTCAAPVTAQLYGALSSYRDDAQRHAHVYAGDAYEGADERA